MQENQKAKAQEVVDQLWNEQLVPFALTIGKITQDLEECTIHFHDSRLRTVQLSLNEGKLFPEMVRAAVLERVAKMSGPLTNWQPKLGVT